MRGYFNAVLGEVSSFFELFYCVPFVFPPFSFPIGNPGSWLLGVSLRGLLFFDGVSFAFLPFSFPIGNPGLLAPWAPFKGI